ncbi:hypothetical protein Q8W71_16105 [Methylobacterium sp. NEAU 140]|uniref:hypothetical protein n=1 Tax=Methylobacterium sp. NEAU 140 TaxID=3064945 RepID=UPI002735853F|nr:hypothetical protein [Methylobacterium sp. NEAU 140]MDP4024153.1 hypothetical protein [Methylobacterium sp. NEAU 140]
MPAPSERAPERCAPNNHARYPWLDEWMGAATPRLCRLVEEATAFVAQHERETDPRQRQRRPADHAKHLTAIEVTTANLVHTVLSPQEGRRAVLTGNPEGGRTRYDNPAMGKPYRRLLGALEDIGWLDRQVGSRGREGRFASSIAPTPAFRAKVIEAGITLTDLGRIEGEEVILAKRKETTGGGDLIRVGLVNYPESEQARGLRETMRAVNAFVAGADITFLDDGLGPVDTTDRVQRRHFLCAAGDDHLGFDLGGRLYGGAWQNLPKTRRGNLRIEGEPIAVLDYASMAPRLAYASLGLEPPEGDIYALPGLDTREVRPAVKASFNTLLCDPFTRTRGWPTADEGDPVLPRGWSVPRFRDALLSRHPLLAPCLGTGMAPQLQNTESVILMEVLVEMKARGIPVLSLHDGLFCPVSRSTEVGKVMGVAASDVAHVTIPVDVKVPRAAV